MEGGSEGSIGAFLWCRFLDLSEARSRLYRGRFCKERFTMQDCCERLQDHLYTITKSIDFLRILLTSALLYCQLNFVKLHERKPILQNYLNCSIDVSSVSQFLEILMRVIHCRSNSFFGNCQIKFVERSQDFDFGKKVSKNRPRTGSIYILQIVIRRKRSRQRMHCFFD